MLGLSSNVGRRADTVNASDNFSQRNSVDIKTQRPLWEGAKIDITWKVAWSLNKSTTIVTDAQGNSSISGSPSVSGTLSRSFLSFPPVLFLSAFNSGIKKVAAKYDPQSTDPDSTMEIPRLCGGCHREGTPVSLTHNIPQENILGNYMDSIHGEGLFKRGLIVTAVCTSCHTAHFVLPHTDPRSSIAKANIAATCMRCHAKIEDVHRQVIRGELWEKQPHLIPACVDCHEPNKVRQVF